MDNILDMNGLDIIVAKMDRIKEGEPMEKTLTVQNETFVVTIDETKSNKLTFIFHKAKDKIAQILLHQEVEKDIQKAKEQFHYGNFIG